MDYIILVYCTSDCPLGQFGLYWLCVCLQEKTWRKVEIVETSIREHRFKPLAEAR